MTLARPARLGFGDLVRQAARSRPAPPGERCDLCSEPVPERHRHVLETSARDVMCACQPCSILFDRDQAGGGHYRIIPDRRLALPDLVIDDNGWRDLGVPVGLAFFVPVSQTGEVVAHYPGPGGPVESPVDPEPWRAVVGANPVLADIEDDVEALLVHRIRDLREAWIVPIDECYRLVALFRRHWEGFSGGDEIWRRLDAFLDELRAAARPAVPTEEEA